VAPPRSVSAPLCAAIERQFPWLQVRVLDDLSALAGSAWGTIQLLLVDVSLVRQLEQRWSELLAQHPALPIAFIADSQAVDASLFRHIDREQVQGVLALDVKLDVFLSSLNIVLHGGTHYAAPFYPRSAQTPRPTSRDDRTSTAGSGTNGPALSRLTEREREILSHIARGSQNKIIAAALGLSEHTVKIHIHNLIAKLHVHNRTEAASIFLRDTPARSRPLPSMLHPRT
jgi:DNA-binding NarL/FixJ family response regulator